ncbi:MAG TPA: DinB family protein [Candidatus Limnocylindrales bacterium]|nr:DinB family protein [Candidatus Limnocylindrales bacterium]
MSDFLADTKDLLGRTPIVVRALLHGLPQSWGNTPDRDGGWRPRDVVGHLITAEQDNWIARIERLLEHGTSQPFDSFNRTAHVGRDDAMTLDQLVDRFVELRAKDLARLAELVTEADLEKRGMHPALGEVTLRELLSSWTIHDLDHISQIFAGMAGSRDADVGAWKTYLGILLRRDDPAAIPG